MSRAARPPRSEPRRPRRPPLQHLAPVSSWQRARVCAVPHRAWARASWQPGAPLASGQPQSGHQRVGCQDTGGHGETGLCGGDAGNGCTGTRAARRAWGGRGRTRGWTAIRAPGPGTAVRLSDPSGPLLHLGSPEAPRRPPRLSASQPRPAAGSHLCPTTHGASTSLCVNVTGRGGHRLCPGEPTDATPRVRLEERGHSALRSAPSGPAPRHLACVLWGPASPSWDCPGSQRPRLLPHPHPHPCRAGTRSTARPKAGPEPRSPVLSCPSGCRAGLVLCRGRGSPSVPA